MRAEQFGFSNQFLPPAWPGDDETLRHLRSGGVQVVLQGLALGGKASPILFFATDNDSGVPAGIAFFERIDHFAPRVIRYKGRHGSARPVGSELSLNPKVNKQIGSISPEEGNNVVGVGWQRWLKTSSGSAGHFEYEVNDDISCNLVDRKSRHHSGYAVVAVADHRAVNHWRDKGRVKHRCKEPPNSATDFTVSVLNNQGLRYNSLDLLLEVKVDPVPLIPMHLLTDRVIRSPFRWYSLTDWRLKLGGGPRCGHPTVSDYAVELYGREVSPAVETRLEYCPECFLRHLKEITPLCYNCGEPIFPGEGVACFPIKQAEVRPYPLGRCGDGYLCCGGGECNDFGALSWIGSLGHDLRVYALKSFARPGNEWWPVEIVEPA